MKKAIQVSSCERGKLHFLAETSSRSIVKNQQKFSFKSGVEPGPRWWKTSSLITAPILRSNWSIKAYFYDTEGVWRDEVGIVAPLSYSRHFGTETRLVGHQNYQDGDWPLLRTALCVMTNGTIVVRICRTLIFREIGRNFGSLASCRVLYLWQDIIRFFHSGN